LRGRRGHPYFAVSVHPKVKPWISKLAQPADAYAMARELLRRTGAPFDWVINLTNTYDYMFIPIQRVSYSNWLHPLPGFCYCYGHLIAAAALAQMKRGAEAEVHARTSITMLEESMTTWIDWELGWAQALLGTSLLEQNCFAEAEPLLLSGEELMELLGAHSEIFSRKQCLLRLVDLYERWESAEPGTGKAAEARKWSVTLRNIGGGQLQHGPVPRLSDSSIGELQARAPGALAATQDGPRIDRANSPGYGPLPRSVASPAICESR
jgi:hypothetical protein